MTGPAVEEWTRSAASAEPGGGTGCQGTVTSVIVVGDFGSINGGQAKIAIESALALRHKGLDVCFVAGRGPLDPRLAAAGIECHVLGEHDILSDTNRLRAAASGIWNVPAARMLEACIASRDPARTVIHVHGWAKALSPSIVRVVLEADMAHVFTLHEYFLACPNGGFYDYREDRVCTRKAMSAACIAANCDSRSYAHKLWRLARQTALNAFGHARKGVREIICLAPGQADVMAPYFSGAARIHQLPNPVGPIPAERVQAEANSTFLFVGRFSTEKGADIAAMAARQIGAPITYCGQGAEQDALLALNPDAHFPGWLDEAGLDRQMRAARCLVFPSKWYEGYPLVLADAIRAGLPVIASDQIVASSLVEQGVNGLLVPAGDVAALASAMERLQSDDVARAMSVAAYEMGRRLLDYETYILKQIEIYELCLARQHARCLA